MMRLASPPAWYPAALDETNRSYSRARWPARVLAVLAVIACAPSGSDPVLEDGSSGDASTSAASTGDPYGGTSGDDGSPPSPVHGATNGQCVAAGTRFLDVFTCDSVLGPAATQPPGSTAQVTHDPASLDDPDHAWVLEQIEACSCTCCHSEGGLGSYVWSHDFAPAWTDSADSDVLDTLGFAGGPNAIEPEDNFGFSRARSGLPTTDATRLQAFIDRELVRRGG